MRAKFNMILCIGAGIYFAFFSNDPQANVLATIFIVGTLILQAIITTSKKES